MMSEASAVTGRVADEHRTAYLDLLEQRVRAESDRLRLTHALAATPRAAQPATPPGDHVAVVIAAHQRIVYERKPAEWAFTEAHGYQHAALFGLNALRTWALATITDEDLRALWSRERATPDTTPA